MAGAKHSKTSCFVPLSTLSVDSKIMELKFSVFASCILALISSKRSDEHHFLKSDQLKVNMSSI